jgi:sugar phosphate isomerase/epimerase
VDSSPPVGIGHLTMLDVAPPDWVALAAEAGFDFVGVRAAPAGVAEDQHPISVGSPMLAETLRRMADTGVRVLDVEIVRLTPETQAAKHEPLFEVGAELGASLLNVIVDDPDLHRVEDNLSALAEEAGAYGLRPMIEPISYSSVKNLQTAVALGLASGGGVTVDPLHLRRTGGTPDDLRSLDPGLLPFYQLCDAPLEPPSGLRRPDRMPMGQAAGGSDLEFEARGARLLPGEGQLPLAEIVAAMPPGLPVAVEAPNLALRAELGDAEFVRRARQSVRPLL